jgi:hypothetical protein
MNFKLFPALRRFSSYLPFLATALIFAALYEVSRNSDFLPYTVAILGAVVLAVSGTLCIQALLRGSSVAVGAMPALLVAGATFAFLFLENAVLRIAVAAAASILFLVLVRHLSESSKLEGAAAELRALSEWSALIALVGLSAGLLAAITFLNWNVWLSALVFAAVATYAAFTLARLGRVAGALVPAAVSVMLVQGFMVVASLPTSHWVGAGLIGAISYLLFSILTVMPFGSLKRAIVSSGAICAVLLATAQWR